MSVLLRELLHETSGEPDGTGRASAFVALADLHGHLASIGRDSTIPRRS